MFDAIKISANRFRRDDDGALLIFGLVLFVLMLMMGGFAVDLMRYENTRTKLQNTLDRSTLAAAALSQQLDREAVVRDYMQKAGIADQLRSVTVTTSLNSAVVNAVGRADTNPFFLHMLGIDRFDAVGRSQAEQAISNLEIVLVLDVSGSMSGTKIANLKIAANQFVDTMLENDPNDRVSITIVPYNAQVNIGPDLVQAFNITHNNNLGNANCVEIAPSDFNSLALSQTDELPMMAYADIATNTNRINGFVAPNDSSYAVPTYGSAFCRGVDANIIRLPNNDAAVLKSQISAMQAGGNTSITLGMKWGATMLDPSMRPVYTQFIGEGKIPGNMAARPFAYDDPDNMKIIILMTDGEHVSHTRVTDPFKSGLSPIYRSTADGGYSVFHAARVNPATATTLCDSRPFYLPSLNVWQSRPWNGTAPGATDCYVAGNTVNAVQQDWRNIWASMKMTYVAWQFYARALGTDSSTRTSVYNSMVAAMRDTWASVPQMDASLDQTCDLVKAQGVIVYGITVDAPTNGQQVVASCSTSSVHYFEATPERVADTFATIASNITMLKLTQ